MPSRIDSLSPRALFYALLTALLTADEAHAHRLDAQVFARPNREIQVESWFSNGDAAKGARVQVFGPQDQLLTEGQLNEQGVFIFSYGDTDPRRVVISAGVGHRKELSISPAAVPLAERNSGAPLKDVLVGVGFLLALAAFVLSLRNAQKLRSLGGPNQRATSPSEGRRQGDRTTR